ncbi:UDP-N-acetylmuramoyl-L-alanine--D-glutamate ligase [bacterium]|nr:UDP-N-acetylmuramoyl-L-alanine--D-glutamate ligase [bacterium]
MNLKGKNVLVVGLGKTGEALCRFLLQKGAHVKVSEQKNKDQLSSKIKEWTSQTLEVETGGHEPKSFLEADLILPSPGVPFIPVLREAQEKGIPVLSEVELAYRFLKGRMVGITGSNGKSTTATLIHNIFTNAGLPSILAGNIGTPLIDMVEKSRDNYIYVTELSSFQLHFTQQLRAFISVFLNVSADHLDWHLDFTHYVEAKKKLFYHLKENDAAVLNMDDPLVGSLRNQIKSSVWGFSRTGRTNPGSYLSNSWILFSQDDEEKKVMKSSEIPLPGPHNQENILAAVGVSCVLGIPISIIRNSVKNFKGLKHRLEKVAAIGGVKFYNDSKATNIQATLQSLHSFDNDIILILGGRDKGGDFKRLKKPIQEKVRKIVLIGEAQNKIEQALKGAAPLIKVSSLYEAVRQGYKSAKPGNVVLLAPACTSFDMFQNFEHRGEIFEKEVKSMAQKFSHKER